MAKASRHPEVNQETTTRLEPKNQILASPTDARDALALQLGGNFLGVERPRQARIEDLDAIESTTGKRRLQADADRLDFR